MQVQGSGGLHWIIYSTLFRPLCDTLKVPGHVSPLLEWGRCVCKKTGPSLSHKLSFYRSQPWGCQEQISKCLHLHGTNWRCGQCGSLQKRTLSATWAVLGWHITSHSNCPPPWTGDLGNCPMLWKADPTHEFTTIHKNISMPCITRHHRHPFVLADSLNHSNTKVSLCFKWLLFHFYHSLTRVLLRLRKISSVWDTWAAPGLS